VCCSVLQCVAMCCSVLQCAAVCCSVLQCAAVCCNVLLQCVAMYYCSVLQCTASSIDDLSKETPPPGEVSFLGGSQVQSLEQDDPLCKTTQRVGMFCRGGPLAPGSSLGNHLKRKHPRGGGFPAIKLKYMCAITANVCGTWLVHVCDRTWLVHVCDRTWITNLFTLMILMYVTMGWLWLVGSLKLQVSFAKEKFYVFSAQEPYKKDDILQKRPIILRSLHIVATPYVNVHDFLCTYSE